MPIISGVKTDAITIGKSNTDSQNFQLSANNDGTAKLARGSDGSLGDILTVDSGGKVTVPNITITQQDSLPTFACRAWVNFDATRNSSGGTDSANTARFIRGSGNVTSVVKTATGTYTITMTTAMPDANYSVSAMSRNNGTTSTMSVAFPSAGSETTTSFQIYTSNCAAASQAAYDANLTTVMVFR